MLQNLFRPFIGVLVFCVLFFVIGKFYLKHGERQTADEQVHTEKQLNPSEARHPQTEKVPFALTEKKPVNDTGTAKDTTELPRDPDVPPVMSDDRRDMPTNPVTETPHASESEAHKEWIAKRNELDRRLLELAETTSALAHATLKSIDEELALMNAFLANLPAAQRKWVHQALLKINPADADALNEFFHDIETTPKLTLADISERAKELLTSREARDMATRLQDAKREQLMNDYRAFFGESFDEDFERFKREHGLE